MSSQPFDYYKNKDVEYDFILSANVNLGETSNEVLPEIISLIKDEDLLAMYFDKIALGRVYPKVEYLNNKLHFTFGISLVDAKERPTSKDLIKNINNFILSLNKNLEDKDIKIKEGDIKVEVITENKSNFDNIDKVLVSENNLYFSRGNDIQRFKLTDDGIVEKYLNESLQETFPFSKLGLSRECKTLVTDGYTLTMKLNETNITNTTATGNSEDDKLDISDPEKTKQNLQQNIKDVEEIQDLKDELDDKMADLMEESIKPDEKFPSTDFSSEPVLYQDLDVETFNKELTAEQKAYINAYLGTIDEFVDAMLLLYNEVGDGIDPMISIDDYVDELLNNNGIVEWSQELTDMLGFDLKTEIKEEYEEIKELPEEYENEHTDRNKAYISENKSKFYTADKLFDDFLEKAKEEAEEDGYTFKLSDLGLTKKDSADFKNLLLQREEIEDVRYDPQNNTYTVKVNSSSSDEKSSEDVTEKIEESVDQYKSSKEEFVDDLVKQILDHFDDEDGWTRSDLQGYVGARCMTTGEDEEEILNMIDTRLGKEGKGI